MNIMLINLVTLDNNRRNKLTICDQGNYQIK